MLLIMTVTVMTMMAMLRDNDSEDGVGGVCGDGDEQVCKYFTAII